MIWKYKLVSKSNQRNLGESGLNEPLKAAIQILGPEYILRKNKRLEPAEVKLKQIDHKSYEIVYDDEAFLLIALS